MKSSTFINMVVTEFLMLIEKRQCCRGGIREPSESQDGSEDMPNEPIKGVEIPMVPRRALSWTGPKTGSSVDVKGMVGEDGFQEINGMPLMSPTLVPGSWRDKGVENIGDPNAILEEMRPRRYDWR